MHAFKLYWCFLIGFKNEQNADITLNTKSWFTRHRLSLVLLLFIWNLVKCKTRLIHFVSGKLSHYLIIHTLQSKGYRRYLFFFGAMI